MMQTDVDNKFPDDESRDDSWNFGSFVVNHLMQLVAQESFIAKWISSIGSQWRGVIISSFLTYHVIFTS